MSGDGQVGRVPPVLRDVGEDDSEVYVIGVRESTDPQSWSLLLMEFDEEDEGEEGDADEELERDDGMDTYCLVVDPGQATYYGGVIECEIAGSELRLVLSEDAASTLGMPQRTQFILDLPPHQRAMLGRGLQRVLTSGRADAVPQLLRV
jgi:Immunity protein 10